MGNYSGEKSMCVTYLFWFFLGLFGAHRFYLRRWCTAVLWLLTAGICGVGWLIDLCVIPCLVNSYNNKVRQATSGGAPVIYNNQSISFSVADSHGSLPAIAPQQQPASMV